MPQKGTKRTNSHHVGEALAGAGEPPVAKENRIDYSDTWTDEDLQDLSTFALSHSENDQQ
jgi:hypothetical protein